MVHNFQIQRKIANDTASNYSVSNPLSVAIVIANHIRHNFSELHYAERLGVLKHGMFVTVAVSSMYDYI